MSDQDQDLRRRAHDLDVTVWVGKAGIESVVDELRDQLEERELVKVKFLRSSRGGTDTETLATELAERAGATVFRTRGHTGVFRR
jgi:RNA-binding protein